MYEMLLVTAAPSIYAKGSKGFWATGAAIGTPLYSGVCSRTSSTVVDDGGARSPPLLTHSAAIYFKASES